VEWKIKKGTPWAYGVWIGEKQINLVFEAAQRKKVKDRILYSVIMDREIHC